MIFICLKGVMMTPIPENSTGVGYAACSSVSGSFEYTVSGLEQCQQQCLANSDCNTVNYCNDGTDYDAPIMKDLCLIAPLKNAPGMTTCCPPRMEYLTSTLK